MRRSRTGTGRKTRPGRRRPDPTQDEDINLSIRRVLRSNAVRPNLRVHATTQRVVDDHFAEERPHLLPFPLHPYDAVLTVERRISQEGMVAIGGDVAPCA